MLVNIDLPGLGHPGVVDRLCAGLQAGNAMLVALATPGAAEPAARAVQAGFDAQLAKPLDFDELLQVAAGLRKDKLARLHAGQGRSPER